MDVLMPDGTVISGVPEGATQKDLLVRYGRYQANKEAEAEAPKPAFDVMSGAPVGPQAGIAALPQAAKPVTPPIEVSKPEEPAPQIALTPNQQAEKSAKQKEFSFAEELKKGAVGAFEYGLPSMLQQVKLQGSADSFIAKQKSLELMNKIDQGEIKSLSDLKDNPVYQEIRAAGQDVGTLNAYLANQAAPNVAEKLRSKTEQDVNKMAVSADTSIDLLNKYAKENQEKY